MRIYCFLVSPKGSPFRSDEKPGRYTQDATLARIRLTPFSFPWYYKTKNPGINPEFFRFTVAQVRKSWNQLMEELKEWESLAKEKRLAG